MDEYFLYIDEAGDEGFGKLISNPTSAQSNWLMIGGIVVSQANDRLLPQWRDQIMSTFPHKRRRDLHFQKIKHEQKVATCRMLSEQRFGACVVCSDKITIHDLPLKTFSAYKQKGHLYNYLVRFLLERVTEACAIRSAANGNRCKLNVTFSKRAGTDYQVMRDYLFLMRDGKEVFQPVRSVDWSVLNPEDVKVEDHSKRAGLQLADVVTSATYCALEPNVYGDTEARYAEFFKNRYLKKNGQIWGHGLTIVPSQSLSKPAVRSLVQKLE